MSAFVGRTDELGALDGLVARAEEAPVATVVIGDPGSGKTRLLAEAVGRAGFERVARVVGYEPEQRVPLSACAELLETLASSAAGKRLTALVFETETSRLEPMRVFEAAHRAVDAFQPMLLIVDDLQWIDELSLALCHYLVRAANTAGQRLALIAAARPSAQAASFAASLAQVLPRERFSSRELGPLSDEEALELVGDLAPTLDPAAARAITEKSGGSPFWLEALVRTSGAELDPAQLVTDRLRGARPDPSTLLALLAVAARPLALADAAKLQGWTAERTDDAARELVSRGVAVHTAGGVRLAHDLVREAAFREVPDELRRIIHGSLAQWLETIAGDDLGRLREALVHRHAAGTPALDLALRIAGAPRRTLLGEEGLALLALIADEADPGDRTALELNAAVAALAGELAKHTVALDRWSRVAEAASDPLQRASALVAASRSAAALDERETAWAYLDRSNAAGVADEVLELERRTQAAALQLWQQPRGRAPGRTRAYDVARRGHDLADGAGGVDALDARARRAYLEALRVEYEAAYQDDEVEALLRTSDERAAGARGFDDEAYLQASIDHARALRRTAHLDESERRLRHAWQEAHRLVLPQLTIDAAYWLGILLELQGRIAEAEDVATEAVELATRVGDEARARHPISRLALKISFHRGEWRQAVAALLAEGGTTSAHARIEFHQDAAVWLAFAGGSELEPEVRAQIGEARSCAEAAACPRCSTELHLATAEALARIGQDVDAARALAEWEATQQTPQPRDHVLHGRIEGLLSGGNGNGAAASLLESAIREADRLGLVLDALWTRIDLGRALAANDRQRSIAVLREAAETAAEVGAITEQQVAEKSLRALGVRTWRRGAASEALTEREREIATLVAAGASNPEIAQELFLSRKTVERHVSNLLKKVGVRNRAELAARVAELKVEGAPR